MTAPNEAKELFEKALKQCSDLMGTLYAIRYRFDPLHDVWHHIPCAQDELEIVKREIKKAQASVDVGRWCPCDQKGSHHTDPDCPYRTV